MNKLSLALIVLAAMVSCKNKPENGYTPMVTSTIHRQSCTESLGFSGMWRLVNVTTAGRSKQPTTMDTLIVNDCSSMERHTGGRVIKSEFKLFKMTNYCADYQMVYKNDSIGCINIVKDTLIFSECSDLETNRYFYKRI